MDASFLDRNFPLTAGSHRDATAYQVSPGKLVVANGAGAVGLRAELAFAGYQGAGAAPTTVLLRHHGLHVEIHIDRAHPIGQTDAAGISDLVLESALTTIQDLEDSVAAVDAEDKIAAYRNWLGLMRGTLEARLPKAGRELTRRLNPDRRFSAPDHGEFSLPGRSLMLVRNVGHHMMSDMMRIAGQPVPETMLDAAFSALMAMHDLQAASARRNSRCGSVYIVKPKLHGPEEAAFAVELFARVEDLLSLPRNTLKMGIMDEERRTTVNLGNASARRAHESCSSTPGSSIAPAMKYTPRWRPARWCARRTSRTPCGSMPMSARTSMWDSNVDWRARADRQGHVGDARADGR